MNNNDLGIIVTCILLFGVGYLLGFKTMKDVSDHWKELYSTKKQQLEEVYRKIEESHNQ